MSALEVDGTLFGAGDDELDDFAMRRAEDFDREDLETEDFESDLALG